MTSKSVGNYARRDIRESMHGLSGPAASNMAESLAAKHGCTPQYVYKLSRDIRPTRKKRTDAGEREWKLIEGTDIWKAAELVIADHYDPDLALLTAATRGHVNLPSLATFQKMLNESGLNRKARRTGRVAFRRWQAKYPGQVYQVDVTALKERYRDIKSRKILRISDADINTNHPNDNPNVIPVWQIMLTDDFSRRRYLKYVAVNKVTSDDIVRFLVEVFCKWGVPQSLYTDNGSEFKGRNYHSEKLLNKITENEGGYEHWRHKPYNAKATGKVEVAHQFVEKMNKLIGTAIREGRVITMELLDHFATQICTFYNDIRECRGTGQIPMNRWYSRRAIIRKLPEEVIESALLSDVFDTKLYASMTVEHKGISYKIPGVLPYVDFIDKKVRVTVPPNIDYIVIGLPTAEKNVFDEYIIDKVLSIPDEAGEFRTNADSRADQLKKRLKETRAEGVKVIKDRKKKTGQIEPLPYVDTEVQIPRTNVSSFPHNEVEIPVERVLIAASLPSELYSSEMGYWEAVGIHADKFASLGECKEFLLEMFGSHDGRLVAADVETAIINRGNAAQTLLRAV